MPISSAAGVLYTLIASAAGFILGAIRVLLVTPLFLMTNVALAQPDGQIAGRVTFMSADGRTELVGYVFKPEANADARFPAVVMMHGRGGVYSSLAHGVYDASHLSRRHKAWGQQWAKAGYMAIMVDGFGPRGYPKGFPRFSYRDRPAELDEVTVRPLDAYGALAYLRSRPDVIPDRIGLQGWSNGGSATIATIAEPPANGAGFRAAIAFYPACALKGLFDKKPFLPYAPVLVFHGTADEEVSHERCQRLVGTSRQNGGKVELTVYDGATHGFDTPTADRQGVAANAAATKDAIAKSLVFFADELKPQGR